MLWIRKSGGDFQGQKRAFGRDFDQIFNRRDDSIDAQGCGSLGDFCQILVSYNDGGQKPLSRLNTQPRFSTGFRKCFGISNAADKHHWLIAEFIHGISTTMTIDQARGTKFDSAIRSSSFVAIFRTCCSIAASSDSPTISDRVYQHLVRSLQGSQRFSQ